MNTIRNHNARAALMSLEAAAVSARGVFACMFSTSDEYETALITERRAQGRYDQPRSRWPVVMFVGCALMVAGTVLLLNWLPRSRGCQGAARRLFLWRHCTRQTPLGAGHVTGVRSNDGYLSRHGSERPHLKIVRANR
jgi:hypothetical protein